MIVRMVAPETDHQSVVIAMAPMRVLLSPTRATRGGRISGGGIGATTTRTTPSTCAQCGIFDLFFYLKFSAVRQKNFF